jgi:hypothetical protein
MIKNDRYEYMIMYAWPEVQVATWIQVQKNKI